MYDMHIFQMNGSVEELCRHPPPPPPTEYYAAYDNPQTPHLTRRQGSSSPPLPARVQTPYPTFTTPRTPCNSSAASSRRPSCRNSSEVPAATAAAALNERRGQRTSRRTASSTSSTYLTCIENPTYIPADQFMQVTNSFPILQGVLSIIGNLV